MSFSNSTPSFISSSKECEVKNIVFLHCLYDSPNHNFDPSRIFFDYIDWILATLRIISSDDQPWIVRSHPHSVFHGEETYRLLCTYPSIKKLLESDNIIFQHGHLCSLPPLNSFLKIVTYSGTVAEEAIISCRRPITIAHTFVSQLFPGLCFRPASLAVYRNILLSGRHEDFCLPADSILSFVRYLGMIDDTVPPELRFSVINGSVQYFGALEPSQIDGYLDIMLSIQDSS